MSPDLRTCWLDLHKWYVHHSRCWWILHRLERLWTGRFGQEVCRSALRYVSRRITSDVDVRAAVCDSTGVTYISNQTSVTTSEGNIFPRTGYRYHAFRMTIIHNSVRQVSYYPANTIAYWVVFFEEVDRDTPSAALTGVAGNRLVISIMVTTANNSLKTLLMNISSPPCI